MSSLNKKTKTNQLSVVCMIILISLASLIVSAVAVFIAIRKHRIARWEFAISQKSRQLLMNTIVQKMHLDAQPFINDAQAATRFFEKLKSKLGLEDITEIKEILSHIHADIENIENRAKLDLAKLGFSYEELEKIAFSRKDDEKSETEEGEDIIKINTKLQSRSKHSQRLEHLKVKVLSRYTKEEIMSWGFYINKNKGVVERDPASTGS